MRKCLRCGEEMKESCDLRVQGAGYGVLLSTDESDQNTLLIVRNPKSAYELVQHGFCPKSINVGHISNSRSEVGRKRLLAFVYVEPDDVSYLRKLMEGGIELEIRAVPADKPIDVDELLKKNSL